MAKELTAEQVRQRCDPALFHCNSTAELAPAQGIIGQDRAPTISGVHYVIATTTLILVLPKLHSALLIAPALSSNLSMSKPINIWIYLHPMPQPLCKFK